MGEIGMRDLDENGLKSLKILFQDKKMKFLLIKVDKTAYSSRFDEKFK